MRKLQPLALAVLLAIAGVSAAGTVGSGTLAAAKDDSPAWCLNGPNGSQTVDLSNYQNFFGSGKGISLASLDQAVQYGGQLWIEYSSNGGVSVLAAPNQPPTVGETAWDGGKITLVVPATVTAGACGSSGNTTTATTPTTTAAPPVTTAPVTTTTISLSLPAGQAYICESNTQTEPSVETRRFAYRLWDKGNFVPYAAHGSYGGLQVGDYSLICNPYHFRLKLTQGKWVNDDGDQVSYLDLGQYPVVVP